MIIDKIQENWYEEKVRLVGVENSHGGLPEIIVEINLEPEKFVILRILDFEQNLVILSKFGIWWNLKSLTLKFQNLKSLTLIHKIWIWTTKIWFFDEFWTNLKKILTKLANLVITRNLTKTQIWILNPKIQNLKSLTLKWQNWLKSPKFWRKFF